MDIYYSIIKITAFGIEPIVKEKMDSTKKVVYKYDGVEFKVVYADDEFIQIIEFTDNTETTRRLGSVEDSGVRRGIKYDTPMLIETDGGFAGMLCSYIFQFSKQQISMENIYQSTGIDAFFHVTPETYKELQRRLEGLNRTTEFFELMHYVEKNEYYAASTQKMIQETMVYKDNFISKRNSNKAGKVTFNENLTLLEAKTHIAQGKKVAVLNFANPVEPGGGILRGELEQEANLCRSSNLYKSLSAETAKVYYLSNSKIIKKNQFNSMFLGTDMIIYSPNVLILKDTVNYGPHFLNDGKEVYQNSLYYVDVITCAAPFFSGLGYILPNGDLGHLFEKRIRNIFETAIEHEVEILVLGAFGCGMFHNPPQVVAEAFRNVLLEERYVRAFDEVVFAVKRTDFICKNIEEFEKYFSMFPDVNDNTVEKKHRLSWKWICSCNTEHVWDKIYCEKCGNNRKKRKKLIFYNGFV